MKHSLAQQIEGQKREVDKSRQVYPRLVTRKEMSQVQADYLISVKEATLKTLEWLAANDQLIKDFYRARKSEGK